MWLQMGEEEGAPLVYFHQVKHMWVTYADGRSGTSEEGAEADERQGGSQVLTARKVEPKLAVLWMQMQLMRRSRVVWTAQAERYKIWGPTRQMLALAMYVGETVRRSRKMAGDWDPDTELHRVRKVMAMVDYSGARGSTKGHTVHVLSPQGSARGAADQVVTDFVQHGLTWWVVDHRGDRRGAVVCPVEEGGTPAHEMGRGGGGGTGGKNREDTYKGHSEIVGVADGHRRRRRGSRGHQKADPGGARAGRQRQGWEPAEVDSTSG